MSKRKRRSFWEPDSPAIRQWIDAQHDLGVSLQLIIVDALARYGNGDVILAHLAERETQASGLFTIHAEHPERIPERFAELTRQIQKPELHHDLPTPVAAGDSDSEKASRDADVSLTQSGEVHVNGKRVAIKTGESAARTPSPEDVPAEKPPASKNQEQEQDQDGGDYNPLQVLLNDAESRFAGS